MEPVVIHNCTFYNENCISGAREHIPDGTIDLIVTDPPYGIQGTLLHRHYNRDEAFVVDGYVEVPVEEYGEFSLQWIKEAERVLRPGGSLYIVSGYTNLYHILSALRLTKLREVNHIVWKYNFGVFTSKKFVSSHYHILFYEKPGGRRTFNLEARFGLSERTIEKRSLNNLDREDVWIINREYKPQRTKNKNELPIALLTKIFQYSTNEGDVVADFFCGGFSTAKVAIGLNRRFVGFEISQNIFRKKIEELQSLEPGFLLQFQRTPKIEPRRNQGRLWTENELHRLLELYTSLQMRNLSKKDTIEIIKDDLGRGYWAIEKALKKLKS